MQTTDVGLLGAQLHCMLISGSVERPCAARMRPLVGGVGLAYAPPRVKAQLTVDTSRREVITYRCIQVSSLEGERS